MWMQFTPTRNTRDLSALGCWERITESGYRVGGNMAGTSTPRKTEVSRTKRSAETGAPTVDLMELFGEVGRLVSRPIRTPDRYEAALEAIGQLLRIPHKEDGPAGNALELLSILVEHYEEENVADLGEASPQEVVQF